MLGCRSSHLLHDRARFVAEDFENALDPRLTKGAKAPQIRPPYAYGLSAHRQCFDDVCATAKAAVYEDRDSSADRLDDFRQDFDCRMAAVDDASPMI